MENRLGKDEEQAAYLFAGKRIVIKYGTNALTTVDLQGKQVLDEEKIAGIAGIVNTLYVHGREPIIVSSAAVVVGMGMLKWTSRPSQLEVKKLQLASSVGQAKLVQAYNEKLAPFGLVTSQNLPVHYNFGTEQERANIKDLVDLAFYHGVVPLFNTNDGMTNEELVQPDLQYAFTDNDPLASLVAIHCKAYSLIIVSENGNFGKGGSRSKVKSFKDAEAAGVHTNLNNLLVHRELDRMVSAYFAK